MNKIYNWISNIRRYVFRPLRLLEINCKCPLRDDCKTRIVIQVLTTHNNYKPEELFDFICKAIGRHLAEAHKVNFFQGLEYKTEDCRYTLMGSYVHKIKDET